MQVRRDSQGLSLRRHGRALMELPPLHPPVQGREGELQHEVRALAVDS